MASRVENDGAQFNGANPPANPSVPAANPNPGLLAGVPVVPPAAPPQHPPVAPPVPAQEAIPPIPRVELPYDSTAFNNAAVQDEVDEIWWTNWNLWRSIKDRYAAWGDLALEDRVRLHYDETVLEDEKQVYMAACLTACNRAG